MALTKINCTLENNPYNAVVDVNISSNVSSISGFNKISIRRRITGESSYKEVYSIDVSSVNDLNFSYFDNTALSGKTYDYRVYVMNDTTVVEYQNYQKIEVWFNGLFVGDMYNPDKQYVAVSNFTTDTKRNTEVAYVTTLGSKYPYRVSNSDTNYTTGSCKGIFLHTTPNKKKFELDSYTEYLQEVLDFLSNGEPKILRTHDGRAWCVGIDEAVQESNENGYEGRYIVSFEWTEIDEMPIQGVVKKNEQ